ncbi:MAG: small multi-drug export protein [bacterium]
MIGSENYLSFLLLAFTGKRIISIPAGIAFKLNNLFILSVVVLVDVIQIPLFYYLYEKGVKKVKYLRWLSEYLPSEKKLENTLLGKIAHHLSAWGMLIISAWPIFGGGIWTAVLFGKVFHATRLKSYLMIIGGSLLGSLILLAGTESLYNFFVSLLNN